MAEGRLQLLWLIAALLIVPASVLTWAHKEVYDLDCSTNWLGQGIVTECTEDDWVVDYRMLSAATVHEGRYDDGTGWGRTERTQFAYSYSGELPNEDGVTILLHAGALMIATTAIATAGSALALLRPRETTTLIGRIAWGSHLCAMLLFLAGLAIHSGTWSGDDVARLAPRWGLLPGFLTLLVGVPLLPKRQEAPVGMPAMPQF